MIHATINAKGLLQLTDWRLSKHRPLLGEFASLAELKVWYDSADDELRNAEWMCSSSLDFPEEDTSLEDVIKMCRVIRGVEADVDSTFPTEDRGVDA